MGQGGANFVRHGKPGTANLVHKAFPLSLKKEERLGCISFAGWALARWLGDAEGMRRWDKKRGTISECDSGLEHLQNGSLLISLQCWQQWEGAVKKAMPGQPFHFVSGRLGCKIY